MDIDSPAQSPRKPAISVNLYATRCLRLARALAWMPVLWAMAGAPYASPSGKTRLMVTIDYCRTYPDLLEAQVNGVNVGVNGMIDACERHGVVPSVFFSPYDYRTIGEEHVRNAARYIVARGCDIQLHTHPEGLYDPDRLWMYEYSLDEQIEIVRHGISKIREWTGVTPVAHRAGGYSADGNTLRALAANRVYLDSSLYWNHELSHLGNQDFGIDSLLEATGMTEVPLSVYDARDSATLFGRPMPPLKPWQRKVDIDWGDDRELLSVITGLSAHGAPTITLFLHYYSFLLEGWRKAPEAGWGQGPNRVVADHDDIREFDALLAALKARPDIEIVSMRQFVESLNHDVWPLPVPERPVEMARQIPLVHYARRAVGIHRQNVRYVLVALTTAMAIIVFFAQRR